MATWLPVVQMEFTHGIGVPEGSYVQLSDDVAATTFGGGDCLHVRVVEAPPVPRRRRRTVDTSEPEAAAVPVTRASAVFASRYFAAEKDAMRWLDGIRRDSADQADLCAEALRLLNRAVRAVRVTVPDPYAMDLDALDPRATRIGVSRPDGVAAGRWVGLFELPVDVPKRRSLLSPQEFDVYDAVRRAVATDLHLFDAEDVAVRALLDLAHDRPRAAAAQARAAAALLKEELAGIAPTEDVVIPDRLTADQVRALAHEVLAAAAAYRAAGMIPDSASTA